jgi:hypothetical protein
MTLNHATMTTQVTRLPHNEFGQPLLADADTIQSWWNQRDDASDEHLDLIHVVTGTLNFDATLLDLVMPAGVREPDLYDEGKAVWLHPAGVVSMDMERVSEVPNLLREPRSIVERREQGVRVTRIHPSQLGVEVDSFHEHNGEVASHSAFEAWGIFAEAVSI